MASSLDYRSLKSAKMLDGLSDEQLRNFWDAGRLITIPTGDSIIKEGDVGDEMYILLEGVVEVSQTLLLKMGHTGIGEKEKTLIRLEGSLKPCFGEMSLMENAERSATVSSLTDSRVLVIDRAHFNELLEDDPSLGITILRNTLAIVSTRLRKANSDVLKLTTALSMALE
jgi:CRP/FNR family transcriptional regulator, cyclic AMP receptor protein